MILNPPIASAISGDRRPTQTRIKVQIPRHYHQQPIISHLTLQHGLEVNILAALLGGNPQDSGWFDLELRGTAEQIDSALIYLSDLDVYLWHQSGDEVEGW